MDLGWKVISATAALVGSFSLFRGLLEHLRGEGLAFNAVYIIAAVGWLLLWTCHYRTRMHRSWW